jgi:NAD(P)-dependent dehydrogenase (short-subunit alcohol dehydrogenase family)
MNLELSDKVAIVTGAGSGIGLAITTMLAEEGAHVVGGDLNPNALKALDAKRVLPVEADLTTSSGADAVTRAALEAYGRIDILVNNVGVFPYRDGFLSTSIEEWQRVLDINFMSMVRTCLAVLPHMVQQNSGSIVSIASECGRQPDVFFVDYSVSKAAVLSLSKSLANEFGSKGVRSNVVSPGPTRTPPWDAPGGFGDSLAAEYGLDKEAAIDHFAKVTRKLPTGRLGVPRDVAAAVAFLASPISRQVTGAEHTVNGGSYTAA